MRDDVAGPDGSEEERYLYERLADLRRSYELTAKPYIERLVQIRSLRPAPSITLTLEQAREFIDAGPGPGAVPHRRRQVEPAEDPRGAG